MAFRRRFFKRPAFRRRNVRSPKAMNTGWVAQVGVTAHPTALTGGQWFTDVIFLPLVELADYADRESLDPTGVPSKQDRCRVLKMVGDLAFQMQPGDGGSEANWSLTWYVAPFGRDEVQNAIANTLGGGLVNYDPLGGEAEFLFRQQRIVEQHHTIGHAWPAIVQDAVVAQAGEPGIRNYRFNKKLGLSLRTDEELYLVVAASFTQITENEPFLAISMLLRFLISD